MKNEEILNLILEKLVNIEKGVKENTQRLNVLDAKFFSMDRQLDLIEYTTKGISSNVKLLNASIDELKSDVKTIKDEVANNKEDIEMLKNQ